MTLVQLEYLVSLDYHRHFSVAAEHCFVTQPTLSMQVQKLEEELGIKLFDRSKQPVVPTEIGESVIRQARVLLRESQKLKELVDEHKGNLAGELRLGIIPTLAPYLLPMFLDNFLKKFPNVKLKVAELTTDTLLNKLKNDNIDVGIVVTPLQEDGILERPLFYEEFVAYVSESEAAYQKEFLLSEDIDLNRLWLLEEGHCFRSQILNLCELQKYSSLHFRYETGNIETVAYGHGRCAGAILTGTLVKAISRRSCAYPSAAASGAGDHRRKTSLPTRQNECVLKCWLHDSRSDG